MLIPCVECGNQVSDQARACPKCGCPAKPRSAPAVGAPVTPAVASTAPEAAAPTAPPPSAAPLAGGAGSDEATFPWQVTSPKHIRLEVLSEASLERQASSLDPSSSVVDASGRRHARLGDLPAYTRSIRHQEPYDPSAPHGVGGWLAFLVAGLIILGPLLNLGRTASDFSTLRVTNPAFMNMSATQEWATAVWVVIIGLTIYRIVIGILLMRSTRRRVVGDAILCLWLSGPGSAIGLLMITGSFLGSDAASRALPEMIGQAIGSGLLATAWTLYLLRSRRVRNTYVDP